MPSAVHARIPQSLPARSLAPQTCWWPPCGKREVVGVALSRHEAGAAVPGLQRYMRFTSV